ncbi:MAG TPA: hypothetical protein PLA20_05665 [Bacilli bacterium]|jgi:hypothetical protein|nr:hypothetical protein [Acholeplasmataceae bacterium]HOE78063.1 hypothetical protein [Bacilli bacterium]HON64442.1 hypothetical protein [Bacilli bacterium]HOR96336.1 hypothetical protein [Bacilli bacterium]HPD12712.1 hypothetical protein [Bacilli bacterium]
MKKKAKSWFCPKKRGFAGLGLVFRNPKRLASSFYLGRKAVLLLDVFPYPLENKGDSYLVNSVVSKLFKLHGCLQEEMELFWFDDLAEMESALDFDWTELNPDCRLIVVLIG